MPWPFLFPKRPAEARPPTAPRVDTPSGIAVRRHFHNGQRSQCYTSWFACWDGWITAAHCTDDIDGALPGFASGQTESWPGGLDAALVGCTLPDRRPDAPRIGAAVVMIGYPAGSRTAERREATVYHERLPGQWIAHITEPDEPVVTGMSGGVVVDAATDAPLGIVITRNSPADLNHDRDPDESADFVALSAVWDAVRAGRNA